MKLRKALSLAAIAASAAALLAGVIHYFTRTSCGSAPVWLLILCGAALALNIAVIALPAPRAK
ncbi:MAG: hypothetical protein PHD32_03130 [Eubacteriales bacterium]|nr:hypothetical protein [Eubacteriales bacterium]